MIAEKQISSPVHVRLDSFNVASHKNHEEVDVNSAVRKAIENAQESIRIATESVSRKKIGLKSFSNNRFKDGFNGEGNMEDDVTAATSSKVFTDFLDAKKLYVAKMIMDEINEKIAELTESKSHDSTQKDEYVADTETIKTETANFVIEDKKYAMFVYDYEAKIEVEDQNDLEINAFKVKKQDGVLEQKDLEYAENVVEDKRINKVFESCEKENESQDDSEQETEVNLHDDRQEDNGKAAGDVDINVNTVETTQDVDVTATSSKFQTQDTEGMEEELCERTSMDQTASDQDEYHKNIIHNEDETEVPRPSKMSGQDHFRRIYEEAAAKERERVKNKLVIERAVSEARDRASAEERERAGRQRAAVKEAIEEARRRKMAEARETVAKSKHKAERAAVERAPSDAHQRAIEKAMYQKTVSDLNSSGSALRTKAKLDKHNRIMERAAKVLAEKEKRDRLAQKEQAERNRLAENLDAEIKRWANEKEGNLRALLSTLQYILGPDSGWQPVSLVNIMTTSDVKKAYRKATLCVHPDKLHQWGVTIQHKYICEKVFDLLKTAWKRFNYEER